MKNLAVARRAAFVAVLAVSFLLASCDRGREQVYQEEFFAFGTLVSVSLYGVDKDLAGKATAAINEDFNYMHRTWHPWEPGPLARVNELLPLQAKFSVPPSVLPLIQQARELSRASGGLFNPAIGRLIKLWGFSQEPPPSGPPPDPKAIAALVAAKPSMDDLVIDGVEMRSTNPSVALDFGAFAKGYGVDRAIEHLRDLGVENAIVNAGGDLRAIGSKGGKPWRIGIRNPRGEGILASVNVTGDESVFTSGDYERFYEFQGKRYHHIIDPRMGYPAQGVTSVTVIHSNAAVADAAATALFIAGAKDWPKVAKAMGVSKVMLVDDQGRIYMSKAMVPRIHFETTPAPPVTVSEAL